MYSDFFEQIDAARNGRRGGRSTEVSTVPDVPPLVSFKAGKMKMVPPSSDPVGSSPYRCEPDTSRGEVRLIWSSSDRKVQLQWYDRRAKKVVDKYTITEPGSTFERVDLSSSKKHKHDRIYVWTKKDGTSSYKYDMYWMQDASDEKDDEIVAQVNQYLADPDSAAPEGTTPAASDSTAGTRSVNGTPSTGVGSTTSASQVDALSSILQNLGMPQGDSTATGGTGSVSTGTQQLTLADLQGAMAEIQAAQQQQQQQLQSREAGPPLNELVTNEAVLAVLESDDTVKQRLIALLPEGQQTEEQLAENLRSPQVQQSLRALTQALLPDENGDLSGYASVIANFSLDPVDGQQALTAGNPIQAFLDCIIKSVQKEDDEEEKDTEANEDEGEGSPDN